MSDKYVEEALTTLKRYANAQGHDGYWNLALAAEQDVMERLAAAEAKGYARAREQAARALDSLALGSVHAEDHDGADTYRAAAEHIRAMQDERVGEGPTCRCGEGAHDAGDRPVVCDGCRQVGGCTGPGLWNTPHHMCPQGGTWRTA